jgi:hypothetical protein
MTMDIAAAEDDINPGNQAFIFFKMWANDHGYTIKIVGDNAWKNKNGELVRLVSASHGKIVVWDSATKQRFQIGSIEFLKQRGGQDEAMMRQDQRQAAESWMADNWTRHSSAQGAAYLGPIWREECSPPGGAK